MGYQTCGFLGSGTTTTTDATSTILMTITVPDDCALVATVHITGRNTSTGDCYQQVAYLAGRNRLGTFNLSNGTDNGYVSATTSNLPDLYMATCSSSASVYSNTVSISVTGILATNIDWFAVAFGALH